jgi:hypothetical protein
MGKFPFVATQLGDQNAGATSAFPAYVNSCRDAQLSIVGSNGRTINGGLVSAYDQGDRVLNPFGTNDVHSRYKQELGRRAALLLAAMLQSSPVSTVRPVVATSASGLAPAIGAAAKVDWSGPTPTSATLSSTDGSITLKWGGATAGIFVNGTRDCWECCDGTKALDVFQVAGAYPGVNQSNRYHQLWTNTTFSWSIPSATVSVLRPLLPIFPQVASSSLSSTAGVI